MKLRIKEITLLTKEEYDSYKDNIPLLEKRWWLRTHGEDKYIRDTFMTVEENGLINHDGVSPNVIYIYVRPVLHILEDLIVGSTFRFKGVRWVVISKNTAICEKHVGCQDFGPLVDDYDKSRVKNFLWNRLKSKYNFEGID